MSPHCCLSGRLSKRRESAQPWHSTADKGSVGIRCQYRCKETRTSDMGNPSPRSVYTQLPSTTRKRLIPVGMALDFPATRQEPHSTFPTGPPTSPPEVGGPGWDGPCTITPSHLLKAGERTSKTGWGGTVNPVTPAHLPLGTPALMPHPAWAAVWGPGSPALPKQLGNKPREQREHTDQTAPNSQRPGLHEPPGEPYRTARDTTSCARAGVRRGQRLGKTCGCWTYQCPRPPEAVCWFLTNIPAPPAPAPFSTQPLPGHRQRLAPAAMSCTWPQGPWTHWLHHRSWSGAGPVHVAAARSQSQDNGMQN